MCVSSPIMCTQTTMDLTLGGADFLSGLLALSISILAIIGTAGWAAVLASFGIALGSVGVTSGTIAYIKQLISAPKCRDNNERKVS